MARHMRLRAGGVELLAAMRDTATADALWDALPLSSRASRWGDEFYFRVDGVLAELEPDATEVLAVGDIGYWVQGSAVAVFFGPTPASRGEEPRAVTAVNVVGSVADDARRLAALPDGVTFHLERAGPRST